MAQHWKPVPGYPDLEVSEDLKVRSKARTIAQVSKAGKVYTRSFPARVKRISWGEYPSVSTVGGRSTVGLHVLICLAWHGLPPDDKRMALHRDGDVANFTPENLYWGDHRDNAEDARKHGTLATGTRHGRHTKPEAWASKSKEC